MSALSPCFLRQFPKSYGPRKVPDELLDILFYPFAYQDEDYTAVPPEPSCDELSLAEKRRLVGKLVELVGLALLLVVT